MKIARCLLPVTGLFLISCGGNGGGSANVSGTVVRPSSEGATVAAETLVECHELAGDAVGATTFSSVTGAYLISASCGRGGAGSLRVPDADARTGQQRNQLTNAQTSGGPLPLAALFDSSDGSVVKNIDGVTTIAERAAQALLASGAMTPDQITAEVIANLENAAQSVEGRTNFRDPASVQTSADQVNTATANGTSPGSVPAPTPTRRPTRRPKQTPTPALTDTPTPTPTPTNTGATQCNSTMQSGADTPESRVIELGTTSGTFGFSWDMVSVADRMQVFYEAQQIFDTGCVSGTGQVSLPFSGASTQIRVDVTPNCANGSGTFWQFTVTCPTS